MLEVMTCCYSIISDVTVDFVVLKSNVLTLAVIETVFQLETNIMEGSVSKWKLLYNNGPRLSI